MCFNKYTKLRKELMSMSKKLTKKEMFAKLKGLVGDNADMVAFIDHEIELLDKKNGSRSMTANQKANENIKVEVLNAMEMGKSYTIGELMKLVSVESNQKLSALVTQLKNDKLVERVEIKGRAYFSKI